MELLEAPPKLSLQCDASPCRDPTLIVTFPTTPDQSLTMWTRFKEQETTATDNHFFITDEDLRKLTANCRPDRSTKSALTALRSLNRIKEIRDGGMLRYAVSA